MPEKTTSLLLIVAAVIWTIPWKGIALWKAAQAKNRFWFTALLIFNSLGLLEILYIFIFSKKKTPIPTEKPALPRQPKIV
jgi:hypothetical protein